MKPAPLAADDDALKTLERRLAGLALRPQDGSGSSEKAASVSSKKYVFGSNERKLEAITLKDDSKGDEATIVARFGGIEQPITLGRGAWRKGRLAYGSLPEQPAAASGAWTGDDTFTAKICFFETPFIYTIRLKFSGEKLLFDSESNVAFGPTKQPQLVGTAE
jgi:hypothetical protein